MSFDPLMKALKDNPALAEELRNAKTPRERYAILDAHGIEKPNLDSQFPEVSGGDGAIVMGHYSGTVYVTTDGRRIDTG